MATSRFSAVIEIDGTVYQLGRWLRAEDAHLARDRARLYFGLPDDRLHSPKRAKRAGPASPEELRRLAKLAFKAVTATSRFVGVSWDDTRKRWLAYLGSDDGRRFLGDYDDEREAAEIYDRILVGLGRPAVNFPDARPSPLTLEGLDELRRAKRRPRTVKKKKGTSRYLGVLYVGDSRTRPWYFYLYGGGHRAGIGGYATEREAAIARDRAALHYQEVPALNFPEEAKKLGAADFETLRAEVRRARKETTTSRFAGVYWHAGLATWKASIHADGTTHVLGSYESEEAAALAYDRAALALLGPEARRNFPRRKTAPALPSEIVAELQAARKASMTSRYRGVLWSEEQQMWIASVSRGEGLGSFDDEEDAALAYDRAALGLFGDRAILNFPNRNVAPATVRELVEESWARYKELTTSQYTGVYWSSRSASWCATIKVEGKRHDLGAFDDEVLAARAYDAAVRRLRDPQTWIDWLNFPNENEPPRAARKRPRPST